MRAARAFAAWVAAGLVAGALVVPAGSARADDPGSVHEQDLQVLVGPEVDGTTVSLDTSVFAPADDAGRHAAIVLAHGFGGSKDDLTDQARELAGDGYVVLTYTARGFGDSGGLIHLDSPDYEVADASRMIDLLAQRDDVEMDAPGDPVVGIAGASYGGALALLTAGLDDRVDAIVPAITWNDLGQALFPDGVFKQWWASLFTQGALAAAARDGGSSKQERSPDGLEDLLCGRFAPDVCRLFQRATRTGRADAAARRYLRASSPASVVDDITAPTLLVQGEQDSLFGLDQADRTARALADAGVPVAVRWIDGGHDGGAGLTGQSAGTGAEDWFDHYLRGGPDPGTAFRLALPAPALGATDPDEVQAPDYFERDLTGLRLGGRDQPVLAPAGGEPAAITSIPGTGPLLGQAVTASGQGLALAALPGQSATFDSEPVRSPMTVAGAPTVQLSITSSTTDAVLFASAWIVDADGRASLPRQLVAPMRLSGIVPGAAQRVEVTLPASAYRLEPGQRMRVVVSATDLGFAVPDDARVYRVGLADSTLTLPTVRTVPVGGGPSVPVPLLVALGLAVLLALVAGLVGRRRARSGTVPVGNAAVLEVDGLVKEYRNGFRAVDGVSWRAERGQVLGLLGPNGAGKTTTMRMLVGLIRSDSGEVRVLGQRVTPGAPVLREVGCLIEGPGHLPHLTGRANLAAYWAATGRPVAEAGLEEALQIADLGAAADRPVRSYSHGMRQRLGIAQAMLGLPELLLLDEPTNGLDPTQIRGLRSVLQRYADAGRTVVVSSHLLGEVEQTCTHVVVMHRGRVVLTGAVDELVAGDGEARRHLEEIFMGLVGDDPTAQVTR
ncbi:alpha/beta fold hydrolase [Nocardioides acrostichi]|uniref:Alpha/beta fold hydrolase n=1 Tax=Nocardioides acrostichi TaxID=2784339 RepID=A0A930V4V3_9ACTN|nr:alpha/beta fold hydrolase [Nocardioides acrostichi]MBF4163785.1 alpha/beta fold hydrolase [Nocardioides acrostichi]